MSVLARSVATAVAVGAALMSATALGPATHGEWAASPRSTQTREVVIFDDDPDSAAAACASEQHRDPDVVCTIRPAREAPETYRRKVNRIVAQPERARPVLLAAISWDAPAGGARARLAELTVRIEDTGAHYRRSDWGTWAIGGSGCDTRETILRRDAVPGSVRTGPKCQVLAGRWTSPYDRLVTTRPAEVQIDHRVPLAEAARSGARGWSRAQREHFYNDQTNLLAVSARSNTSKGDRDPGRWLPPNMAARCDYAVRYIDTKRAYRLTVDRAERDALAAMLNTCPPALRGTDQAPAVTS